MSGPVEIVLILAAVGYLLACRVIGEPAQADQDGAPHRMSPLLDNLQRSMTNHDDNQRLPGIRMEHSVWPASLLPSVRIGTPAP